MVPHALVTMMLNLNAQQLKRQRNHQLLCHRCPPLLGHGYSPAAPAGYHGDPAVLQDALPL